MLILMHIVRMAFTAFFRFKLHSFINLVSLVFGFVCFVLTMSLSNYINSFDKHFPNADSIYTLIRSVETASGGGALPMVSQPLSAYLRTEFPELEQVVRATPPTETDVKFDDTSISMGIRFVENGFLNIFPLEMLSGALNSSNLQPNTALISENAARKTFGTIDVIGQNLLLANQFDVTIVGVIRKFEKPSHIESAFEALSSDLIVPIEVHDRIMGPRRTAAYGNSNADDWNNILYYTYLQFPPGDNINEEAFQNRLDNFTERVVPKNPDYTLSYSIQPLNKLTVSLVNSVFGSIDVSSIISAAGYLILLVACLNYSNLTIAQLSIRSQEIGVQKILGAKRWLLVLQYSLECLIFILMPLILAFILLWLIMNAADSRGFVGVNSSLLLDGSLWTRLLLALAVVIAIAGSYPAIRTVTVPLVTLLRPKGASGYSGKLRSIMVGTQFLISGTLIIFSFVVFNQNQMMTEQLDGDTADPKMAITVSMINVDVDPSVLQSELENHPGILSTTLTATTPWSLGFTDISLSTSPDQNSAKIRVVNQIVGFNFAKTLDVPFIAGREYDESRASDSFPAPSDTAALALGPYSIVVDRATIKALGFESAEDAIGQVIYRHLSPPLVDSPIAIAQTIIGVTGQQKFQIIDYARFGLRGNVYSLQPDRLRYVIIRSTRSELSAAIRHMESTWENLAPGVSLQYRFLDDLFYSSYQIFVSLGMFITLLSIFGFVIASIGLLGNATFITNIRRKEVGIRKVMGASSTRLLRMLLLDFAKPVLIANAISWPLSYVAANAYISLFSVQASITIAPFLISLLISVSIASLSVGFQAWKSAKAHPAAILRYE
ncbi:MAG: hypothetical protein COA78_04090 [Blastopirellula sp.]|nr:MAG: hypothetical protein COA78_04090 [Blastopirellula sp.]